MISDKRQNSTVTINIQLLQKPSASDSVMLNV